MRDGGNWTKPQLWEVADCGQKENNDVARLDLIYQLLVDEVHLFHGGGMRSIVQGCTEFFLWHPSGQGDWESVMSRVVQNRRGLVAVEAEIL